MSFPVFVDGTTPLTASDLHDLRDQGLIRFVSRTARGLAITAPTEGMVTQILDLDTIERYDGSAWKVLWSKPIEANVVGAPNVSGAAADASTIAIMSGLLNGTTYDVRGFLRVTGATCSLTSTGSLTGVWGNAANGADAALFDLTSADAIVPAVVGLNPIHGRITATADGQWLIKAFAGSGSTIVAPSHLELERVT